VLNRLYTLHESQPKCNSSPPRSNSNTACIKTILSCERVNIAHLCRQESAGMVRNPSLLPLASNLVVELPLIVWGKHYLARLMPASSAHRCQVSVFEGLRAVDALNDGSSRCTNQRNVHDTLASYVLITNSPPIEPLRKDITATLRATEREQGRTGPISSLPTTARRMLGYPSAAGIVTWHSILIAAAANPHATGL
jgi:hypothetical protein